MLKARIKKEFRPALEIRELSDAEFNQYFKKYSSGPLLGGRLHYRLFSILSPKERSLALGIQVRLHGVDHVYLGAFIAGKIVGWSCGFRATADSFYISNSVIFPKFRGHSYHTQLLNRMIEHAKRMGFQTITCHHYPTLNHLIAKKLEMGFYVTGYEVLDTHGVLLKMTYFLDPSRKASFLRQLDIRQ